MRWPITHQVLNQNLTRAIIGTHAPVLLCAAEEPLTRVQYHDSSDEYTTQLRDIKPE